MRHYELYRSEPDMIGRVYETWGLGGQTLRSATRQELASYLESFAAACAIYENVQALLQGPAGEAPLPEDEAPLPEDEAPLLEAASQ